MKRLLTSLQYLVYYNQCNLVPTKNLFFTMLLLVTGLSNSGDIFGQVTLSGLNSVTCPAIPTAVWTTPPSGITFSQISRGSGVSCSSASTGISGSGFNTDLATNLSGSKWYTFDITANATTNFSLSSLAVQSQVSSATGSPSVSVQYSINGGAKIALGSFTPTTTSAAYTISFTAINVCAGQILNIFIVPNTLTASGTTCRYNNASTVTLSTTVKATATFSGATTICNGSSTSLNVAVTNGTSPYTLNLDNGGGTATSATPVSKSVSPTATTAYTATITDANTCPATITGNTQTVTVDQAPTTSVAGMDQSATSTSFTMAGNTPTVGTGTWTLVSNTSTTPVVITTPASPTTTVTGVSANKSAVLAWTIANGVTCPTSSTQVTVNNTTVLAAELISLKAKATQTQSLVTWQTATEQNNSHFNVERSQDGIAFDKIGEVKGAGTSTKAKDYSFVDASPAKGTNYYQLRQVDLDGKETVSKTVAVNFDGKVGKAKVYPTLVKDVLTVELTSDAATQLSVRDVTGRLVLSKNTEGVALSILDLGSLNTGVYFIIVQSNQGSETMKVFKQ